MESSRPISSILRLSAAATVVLGLGAAVAALLPAQIAGASTWTVSDCSASATDPMSLPYAVANAVAGDTINITASCPSGSPVVLQSALTISVNLSITGPGATSFVVSGGSFLTPFIINSGVTASISGLTVENGKGSGSGGGINNNGNLTLTNSTVTTSTVPSGKGGGIANGSGTLALIGSTVSSNQATAAAGTGAGIYNGGGTVTLTNSTVSGNSSSQGSGGGIYNLAGSLTLTNSTVSGNSTDHFGGGIYSFNGPVTLTDSTVSGNTVSANGGGIYNTGTNGTAVLTVTGSTVSGNTGAGAGGGIFNGPGSAVTSTITDSTVSGNTVSGLNFGAGIYNSSGILSLTSSTVAGNGGAHTPGGIDLSAGTINMGSTILASNTGGNCVGAAVTDQGYNVAGDGSCALSATGSVNSSGTLAASLGTLTNNGGPTATILPSDSSPAVGQIPPSTTLNAVQVCPGTDQRGYSRPGTGQTDCTIGAVEADAQPSTAAPEFAYPFAFPVLALVAIGGVLWFRKRRTPALAAAGHRDAPRS